MQFRRAKPMELATSLPLIPMASVLVMLLVFLLLGMQMRRGPQAHVQLPNVDANLNLPDRRGPRLELTADALRLNDEKIATAVDYRLPAEAAPRIAEELKKLFSGQSDADKRILIYGDRRLPFAALSALVKHLTTNGISNISLAVIHRVDVTRTVER